MYAGPRVRVRRGERGKLAERILGVTEVDEKGKGGKNYRLGGRRCLGGRWSGRPA